MGRKPLGKAKADRAIRDVMAEGHPKGNAIAILKSRGVIKQAGRHLVAVRKGR